MHSDGGNPKQACHGIDVVCRLVNLLTQLENAKSTGTISLTGRSLLDGRSQTPPHARMHTHMHRLPLHPLGSVIHPSGRGGRGRLAGVHPFEFQERLELKSALCFLSRRSSPRSSRELYLLELTRQGRQRALIASRPP